MSGYGIEVGFRPCSALAVSDQCLQHGDHSCCDGACVRNGMEDAATVSRSRIGSLVFLVGFGWKIGSGNLQELT